MYEVNDQGSIRSWRGWGGQRLSAPRQLSPVPNHDGYPVISLIAVTGRRRQHFVHVLVAETFLGPRPDGRQVAHGNGDRADARLVNLRYATPAENEADKVRHGTQMRGGAHPNAVVTDANVLAIRKEYVMGATQTFLANKYGTHQTNISLIVRGRTRRVQEVS